MSYRLVIVDSSPKVKGPILVRPPTSHRGNVWNIYLSYVFLAYYIFQCSSQIMSLTSAVKHLEVWLHGTCLGKWRTLTVVLWYRPNHDRDSLLRLKLRK